MNSARTSTMNLHAELIESASNLLNESGDAARWLPVYDAALASKDDLLLEQFCRDIRGARKLSVAKPAAEPSWLARACA